MSWTWVLAIVKELVPEAISSDCSCLSLNKVKGVKGNKDVILAVGLEPMRPGLSPSDLFKFKNGNLSLRRVKSISLFHGALTFRKQYGSDANNRKFRVKIRPQVVGKNGRIEATYLEEILLRPEE